MINTASQPVQNRQPAMAREPCCWHAQDCAAWVGGWGACGCRMCGLPRPRLQDLALPCLPGRGLRLGTLGCWSWLFDLVPGQAPALHHDTPPCTPPTCVVLVQLQPGEHAAGLGSLLLVQSHQPGDAGHACQHPRARAPPRGPDSSPPGDPWRGPGGPGGCCPQGHHAQICLPHPQAQRQQVLCSKGRTV